MRRSESFLQARCRSAARNVRTVVQVGWLSRLRRHRSHTAIGGGPLLEGGPINCRNKSLLLGRSQSLGAAEPLHVQFVGSRVDSRTNNSDSQGRRWLIDYPLCSRCSEYAIAAKRKSPPDENMSGRYLDVVAAASRESSAIIQGCIEMIPALILLFSTFGAGFFAGYGARAWRSHRQRSRDKIYAPYYPQSSPEKHRSRRTS